MTALRVGIAGNGAERMAQQLAEAALQHGVWVETLVLATPACRVPQCDHLLLIAGDDDAPWRDAFCASAQPFSVLHADTLECALDVIATLRPQQGLLTRLQQRDAAQPSWRWVCEKCDSPECEPQSMDSRRR